MTIGRALQAHALSLPIFSLLDNRKEDGSNSDEVITNLQLFFKTHNLDEHLSIEIKESPNKEVGLTSKTEFGAQVLSELYTRCEFFPCPDGECDYAPSSFCKWCGKLKG